MLDYLAACSLACPPPRMYCSHPCCLACIHGGTSCTLLSYGSIGAKLDKISAEDDLEVKLSSRLDDITKTVNTRLDNLVTKFDEITGRFSAIETVSAFSLSVMLPLQCYCGGWWFYAQLN